MARRYGILNKKYDSQLRRCAISGLRFYRSEMVKVAEDRYIYHKYVDEDYHSKARGGQAAGISDDVHATHLGRALIKVRPSGELLEARAPHGVRYRLIVGGVY